MSFAIEFSCTPAKSIADSAVNSSAPVLDTSDTESLLDDACSMLAERGGCQFSVAGFGDPAWPVDIDFDLCSVLPQLPEVVAALRGGKPATLEFYEQGLQRVLDFTPTGETVRITCRSGTNWTPSPADENTPRTELVSMLERVATNFAHAVIDAVPDVADLEPLASWHSGEV